MLTRLTLGLSLFLAAAAAAEPISDVKAREQKSAYAQDARGNVTRSGFGLCWRSGEWSSQDAIPGCDGPLAPPIVMNPSAPPIAAAPAAMVAAPVLPAPAAPAPARCDQTLVLASDHSFGFNQASLGAAAKRRLEQEIPALLAACTKVQALIVTAYSDRLGSQGYNQRLSERRAASVAAYLRSQGAALPIETLGAGAAQEIQACPDTLPRQQLIACLAPNRRVKIEIRGDAK